jgi:hypothetical protein
MKKVNKIKYVINKIAPLPLNGVIWFFITILLMLAFRTREETISFFLKILALVMNALTILHCRDVLFFEKDTGEKEKIYVRIKAALSILLFFAINFSLSYIDNWKVAAIFFTCSVFLLLIIYIKFKYF